MTTESLFCTDPEVLLQVKEVNGYAVLASETDGNRTYVLCHLTDNDYTPFVTWSIWRTEDGKIAAESGDYMRSIADAVIDLYDRAGNLDQIAEYLDKAFAKKMYQ